MLLLAMLGCSGATGVFVWPSWFGAVHGEVTVDSEACSLDWLVIEEPGRGYGFEPLPESFACQATQGVWAGPAGSISVDFDVTTPDPDSSGVWRVEMRAVREGTTLVLDDLEGFDCRLGDCAPIR